MKSKITALVDKIKNWEEPVKYLAVIYVVIFSFVIYKAFASYQNTQQANSVQADNLTNKTNTIQEKTLQNEALAQESISTKKTNVQTPIQINNISEVDQAEIDRIKKEEKAKEKADAEVKKQLEKWAEIDKKTKEMSDNLKTVTPPPSIKPLPEVKAPTPITVKPLDGTIEPTGRPADVCASSASKFLPECR